MPSHASVAASVRQQKEKHPANYCPSPRCLWRIVDRDGNPTPCRNHSAATPTPATTPAAETTQQIDIDEFVRASLAGAIGDDTYTNVDEACAGIERNIAARIRRQLNTSETVKLGIIIALEWNRRKLAIAEPGELVSAPVPGVQSPWHTTDDRYFARDCDARDYQRTVDAKAAAHAFRVAAYEARQAERRDVA